MRRGLVEPKCSRAIDGQRNDGRTTAGIGVSGPLGCETPMRSAGGNKAMSLR